MRLSIRKKILLLTISILILSVSIFAALSIYIIINQGCLYTQEISPEGIEQLVLKGTFAFDRKKFINDSIPPGHGLLGQALIAKETLYLTDIPGGVYENNIWLGRGKSHHDRYRTISVR